MPPAKDAAVALDLAPAPPPPSDNPIDVAVWPRFISSGNTQIEPAPARELCRRISLDLTGVAPTSDELVTHCDGKGAGEMVDYFLASPAYPGRELKLWIEALGEDPARVLGDDLLDADAIIDRFARGQIGYDDFAAQLLAHPVMTLWRRADQPAQQFVEDAADHAFLVLLGRTASPAERSDFANLLKVWQRTWNTGAADGYGTYVMYARVSPASCSVFSCSSILLGPPTTINLPLPPNVACNEIGENGKPFQEYGVCFSQYRGGKMPDAVRVELEKPGRLLAMRREFWDQAVDRALARMLGWWKSSANEADTILPEVREAASNWFRAQAGHDIRKLYKLIATSILYTQSQARTSGGDDLSPWFMGPMKMMDPEQFLDSTSDALSLAHGFCDPHTADKPDCTAGMYYIAAGNFPKRLRKDAAALPKKCDDPYFYYYNAARSLGGCQGGAPSPSQPGMPAILAEINLARDLCTAALLVPANFDLKDASDNNLQKLVAFQFNALLGRPPDAEEIKVLTTSAGSCRTLMSCTVDQYAREVCGALIRSGSYLYY